uniref:Uncharacterized protein n=1 Tax=Tanacetum cinerariifolium TaxID=118510 RepID=A0A6L2MYE9_TANCI|nr:hypothetical protein [Tanacetum cinerariifolium]
MMVEINVGVASIGCDGGGGCGCSGSRGGVGGHGGVMKRLTSDGDDDGDGGWRVVASDMVDRVDRETGSLFGVRLNRSPENFSGGGWPKVVAAGRRPAGGEGERGYRRLKVKARSTLMMGIPNEHQLKFNSIKDAKKLLEAVEKRFDGNATTKKTQRNILKQQYENYIVSSSEILDQTFDRLQKLRNKADLDTMSIYDLYKNLKVYEPQVKRMSSSSSTKKNMAFVQPDTPQLIHEDLEQIHPDDMEKMYLRWQMAMLSMRDRRFLKKTRRKLIVNGNETIGFDKSNVECYNYHKRGYFAREYRAPRNQDNKNKESIRKSVPMETSTSTALVSCDGLGGYDWSDQAEEGPNYVLMAFLSSSFNSEIVHNCKKGLGYEDYNAVSPPYTENFMPPTPDLPFTGLDDFVNKPITENCKAKSIKEEAKPKIEKKIVRPSIAKIEFVKPKQQGKNVKQVEQHTQNTYNPRGNQRNWNNMMSQKLGRNMSYLIDYKEIDRGYVAFGGNPKGGKIIRKGTIKTGNIDFKNVYFVKELKFNIFSVLKICVKKNSVLFNDTECIVLSPNFKLIDESQVLLRVPRKNNMYSVDLKNIVPKGGLTYLFAKATSDKSKLSHKSLGHLKFKTMNKLVKKNLVRGLPSKLFKNDLTCVACQKGKEHSASCKPKIENSVSLALHLLHMDLFGLTFVQSLMKKMYCLVVTDDYSSKAFRVFNCRTMIVEENLHIRFSESTPNVVGSGPDWLFDIDALTRTMNYEPIVTGTQSNGFVDTKSSNDAGSKLSSKDGKMVDQDPKNENECNDQEKEDNVNSTNNVNTISSIVNIADINEDNELPFDPNMPSLEDVITFDFSTNDEYDGVVADMNNLDTTIQVSLVLTIRIHKEHPLDQVIEYLQSATQTRKVSKNLEEHGFVSTIQQRTNHKDLQNCLFACFLSQEEPKKIEEDVYVCQPPGYNDPDFLDRVYKIEKALYGQHQAPRDWHETLSTYLLDNGFRRGKINKTLFIKRHKGDILCVQVYVDDIIFELTFFLGLQVKKKKDGTFISLDKYVAKILKKFGFTEVKTASTPMKTQKPLLKDEDGKEVNAHMYRSMIGSLMYLTSLRPDIIFVVCACARYQVNPKVSHLYVVKKIIRYLKGQQKLGLWYPKDSFFDLVAYTNSDYARASLDRIFTTRGCQFIGCRLRSWQCKK